MITEFIKRKLRESIEGAVSDIKNEVYDNVSYRVRRYKRKIIKDFVSIILLLVAIIFLAVAVVYALIEYGGLTNTLAFGVLGIVILIVALILKIMD